VFWPLALHAIHVQGEIYRHTGGLAINLGTVLESHVKPRSAESGKTYTAQIGLGKQLALRDPTLSFPGRVEA